MPPIPSPPIAAGRRAVADAEPVPVFHKAPPIEIPRRAAVGEAFALIGSNGIAHLRANEACVRVARDVEGIHQLRVSVRRMRSALSLFRRMIAADERRDIAGRLKWIAGECAEARDWDVFEDELLAPLGKSFADDRRLAEFAEEVARIRSVADVRVADMLAGRRYGENVRRIEAWWAGGEWRARATGLAAERAGDFAATRLGKFHRRLCRLGKRTGALDDAGLHDLRIRVKKLRYAVGFFGSLYPNKSVRACRAALDDLQDCLGAFNDTIVAGQLLAAVERRAHGLDPAAFDRAAGLVAGWTTASRETGLARLPRLWRRFAGLRPFWK